MESQLNAVAVNRDGLFSETDPKSQELPDNCVVVRECVLFK